MGVPWVSQLELVHALAVHPQAIQDLIGVLQTYHFDNPALGAIAVAAMETWQTYRAVPTEGQLREALTVLEPRVHAAAIELLPDVLGSGSPTADWAVDFGRRMAAEHELRRLHGEILSLAEDGKFDTVVHRARQAAQMASPRGELTLGAGSWEEATARHSETKAAIPTGVARLDRYLAGGGLKKGSMGHILGKKGGGKSHALVHMGAQAILRGSRVLHITLEMPAPEVRARYDRHWVGKSGTEFLLELAVQWEEVKQRHELLHVLDASKRKLTVAGLEAAVERLEQPPDLVVLDYLQLLRDGNSKPSEDPHKARMAMLGEISMDLHILAQEKKAALWTAYQANRVGIMNSVAGGGHLDTTHYAESLAASFPAEVIVSLNQTPLEMAENKGRIFLAENRGGPSGRSLDLTFDWATSRILE